MRTGIIYKIIDNTNSKCYYGATIQKMYNRKAGHKRDYKRYLKGETFYTTACDIFDNNNFEFHIIETIENDNINELKKQLTKLERFYIENNECVNKVIPGRSKFEYRKLYYEKHREKLMNYAKNYYENNKNMINDKRKQRLLVKKNICNII